MATVVGSSHDFSTGGTSGFQSTNEDEVCIFCHTPHGAVVSDGVGNSVPLWNRNLNRTEAFTMYDSQTFDGKTTYTGGKPTGMSLLCLSCHDGVSTINSVINYGPDGAILMPATMDSIGDVTDYPPYRNPNIGRDLSNDHPVSFLYDTDLVTADTATRGGVAGLYAPGTVTSPGTPTAPLILYNNRLECSTCHDPHEFGDPDKMPFLRMSNAGSAMCTTCHIK